MLKIKFLLTVLLLSPLSLLAQKPVNWTWKYDASENAVKFKVVLSDGWHLYSQHVQNDIGPVPTQFVFENTPGVEFIGTVQEPVPVQKYDENFEATLDFFEKEAEFKQKVKGSKGEVKGTVTYMVCNETMCLPPVDLPFTITLDKN
jgi:thiol:disulfide interchange protein DsbD